MKIAYLGAGTWAFCLGSLLAAKGHCVTVWTHNPQEAERLQATREHPKLPGFYASGDITFTSDIARALDGAELVAEGVTSAGIRPVCKQVRDAGLPPCPFILTSKGIEQNTGLLLSEVALEIFGADHRQYLGCLSGPSHAEEVIKSL